MSKTNRAPAEMATLTRSDVEWIPGTDAKPCTCGKCLICEVEALAGPAPEADAAFVERHDGEDGDDFAAQYDNDPNPYDGTYSED